MEDMFFPLHMMNHSGFGDVAISAKTSHGITFKQTSKYPPADFKNAIFKFQDEGTGFLISILEIQIDRVSKKFGLLLTAAHVVIDIATGKPKKNEFLCELNGRLETAFFLKEFLNSGTDEHLSNTTMFPYCLPGDVAVLLITLENCNASMFYEPIKESSLATGMKCYIPGFPAMPPNPKYCIPNLNQTNDELANIISVIFNNFSGIAFSHGSVIDENGTILEIDCSTTCGMSGSPIVSHGKYIGVYVGGPALPGQKELIDIIKTTGANQYTKAFQILKSTMRL